MRDLNFKSKNFYFKKKEKKKCIFKKVYRKVRILRILRILFRSKNRLKSAKKEYTHIGRCVYLRILSLDFALYAYTCNHKKSEHTKN